nr:hypothetical protein [Tanacetum cinerariifolium]
AILEKSEHNVDFHPIVDFVEASPLRIETTEKGTKILATVDGILRPITKSSLRRNLKLQDEEGISSLPDTELFEKLTLMGYNISPNQKFTFQKGQFSHQWKYLIHTIMQCLSPKSTGFNEFSSNIATALVWQYTRRARIAQSSALPPVADEPASPLRDVSQGEACPTDSGFEADQDKATIAKTSNLPHDSAPRVTSSVSAEGSMQQLLNELTAFCTSLQRQHSELISKFEAQELEINRLKVRVKLLDDKEDWLKKDLEMMPQSRREIWMKGRQQLRDICHCHCGHSIQKKKGKEVMVESKTPKKQKVQEQIDAQVAKELEEQLEREDQRMSEQIAKDAEVARIYFEEELQSMIDGLDRSNETVAKGMTFEEIEAKFTTVWKQIEDFIPMGSKEEVERLKRKGLSLDQESVKKLKTSEEVIEEAKSPDEVPEEKVKEMMQMVPIEEVYVEALQVKHPIIDWKVHTEGRRSY